MLNSYLRKVDAMVNVETDPVFNTSIAKGITGIDTAYWNRKTGNTLGNIQYWNGTGWVNLAPGQNGQTLILVNGIPSWSGVAYPSLTTSSVSSITSTSAGVGGNIFSDGGASVSARGLVYGTAANPTLSNTVLIIGSGTGGYAGTISGLMPNTTYYVRAYATNITGTGYGNEISFTTSDGYFKGFVANSNVFLPIDTNQWQYIAITKENNIAKIYKNGQLLLTGEYTDHYYSWDKLELGAVFYTSYNNWFQGFIDEIRISNIVRSQAEISDNFSANAPFSSDSNTIGLWHFDENSGSQINASAGVNGSTINTNWVEGKFGNCLYYNGIDARSEFLQNLPVSILSFEFWIKPETSKISWPISWYGYNTSGLILGF
jgi:hypothetical protein